MRVTGASIAVAAAACLTLMGCAGASRVGVTPVTPALQRDSSSNQDLLYISEYGGGVLDIFSWPQAQYVRSIGGFASGTLMGLCTDKKGDVWVVEAGSQPQAQEFSHTGSVIGGLVDRGESPYGCAIDPRSGDFAMTSEEGVYNQPGSVAVWKKAAGNATTYLDPSIELMLWCG